MGLLLLCLQQLAQHDVDVEREHVAQLDAVRLETRRELAGGALVVEGLRQAHLEGA